MVTGLLVFLCTAGTVTVEDALVWLDANSPACDLVPAYEQLLLENATLAVRARDSLPWGAYVPDSIFLRYVLPIRVSQEPLTAWRMMLYDELMPLAASAGGLERAAEFVLAWCDSVADFRQTQRRDQSPLVTIASGSGRCEELTILQMDALRAVGIPCRQTYTPWWTVCDNNHAWTEVWTLSGWVSTESGVSVDSLDQPTWFDSNASRAGLVVSVAQGTVPGALLTRGSGSLLNVTSDYAPTGILRVTGDAFAPVFVNIVNWGALRPLFTLRPPRREIELGPAVYMLTWGWPMKTETVSVTPGDTVVVDLAGGAPLPEVVLLNQEGTP